MPGNQEIIELAKEHIDVTRDHFRMTNSFITDQLDVDSLFIEMIGYLHRRISNLYLLITFIISYLVGDFIGRVIGIEKIVTITLKLSSHLVKPITIIFSMFIGSVVAAVVYLYIEGRWGHKFLALRKALPKEDLSDKQ